MKIEDWQGSSGFKKHDLYELSYHRFG